jgi:hypothetical protein
MLGGILERHGGECICEQTIYVRPSSYLYDFVVLFHGGLAVVDVVSPGKFPVDSTSQSQQSRQHCLENVVA